MKEIIENKLLVTPIAKEKSITINTNKTFAAGTATKEGNCCLCCCGYNGDNENNQVEVESNSRCSEPCNCIIPFCTTMNIPQDGGILTTNSENKRVYYVSNLYYSIDQTPCLATLTPPEGCIDLEIDIYPIRVLGSIDYSVYAETETSTVGAASDTGGTSSFIDPVRANGLVLTQERTINVNQVVGYITDSESSPVQNGQSIATGELEIAFTINAYDCESCRQTNEGVLIRCVGNFKLKNCPLTNSEPE